MFRWQKLNLRRLYGLDLKTNVVDVKDGYSLDLKNVIQNANGVISKRAGNQIMFASDEASASVEVNEVGQAKLGSTRYYFKFSDGDFHYSTTLTGATTSISPSPAISTTNKIWWVALDNKLYFADGENNIRFFDGSTVKDAAIYERPTVAATCAGGPGTFDYLYTVDNGQGESPASPLLEDELSAATIRVPGNTGPQTLAAGDIVRIYSRVNTVTTGSKLVSEYTWLAADVTAGFADIATVAINDNQAQLYTELGLAANRSAVLASDDNTNAIVGIIEHYGRIIAWRDDEVLCAKIGTPSSFPANSAVSGESFRYEFASGDGEGVQRCISFQESCYVMKKTKIAIFGGLGPDDTGGNPFVFRRLETNGIGCVAPKSVAVIGENEDQSYIIFLSRTGWYGSNGSKPVRLGENVETEIFPFAESTLSSAVGCYHKRDGYYMCVVGSQGNRKVYTYDTRKDKNERVGWFRWEELDIESIYFDEFENRYLFGGRGFAGVERNAGTTADFSDIKIEFVASGSVNTASDAFTVTESYTTGDQVVVRTSGTIPSGLTANTTYYVIVSGSAIKFATSQENALNGVAIDITTQGSGTHTVVGSKAISAYYTTNWISFGAPEQVKKLAKPSVILNAAAASVLVTMQAAYDWSNTFGDTRTVTFRPAHSWGEGVWGGGSFTVWGGTDAATPKNAAISRRKVRSVRYKFSNSTINTDFDLQGIIQPFSLLRNIGNFGDV